MKGKVGQRSHHVVIELCIVKFLSEIILLISNRTHSACSFDFEITPIYNFRPNNILAKLSECSLGENLSIHPKHFRKSKLSEESQYWVQKDEFEMTEGESR